MAPINLLALSGSLRSTSYNTAAIEALKALAPPHITIQIGSISELPLFNPDLDELAIPALVNLRDAIKHSDGLIIASPEYAHGVSGPMKNALDWLVSSFEFPYKPIMLINTSPRASHAQVSLIEILTTMSGVIVDQANTSIPLLGSDLDANGILEDGELVRALKDGLDAFYLAITSIERTD